jgi:hypothetical protein
MTRDDLQRRLSDVREGIEAATVMQDYRTLGQLARQRDKIERELAGPEESDTDVAGERLLALEEELRRIAEE